MTMDDFMRLILTTWPDAVVDENQVGELVIMTGHRVDKDNNVVRLENDEPF
jgi:hypothetical protein